jgi:predicted DNA-binding antitoxin AbrB/MazE fold protein
MPIAVEAVYEDGVLKPVGDPPLKVGEAVRITARTAEDFVREGPGLIGWRGGHEEWEALLNDQDAQYGNPDDWFPQPRPEGPA